MRSIILAAAALLAAVPVAAQHCWPSSIALLIRDEHGTVLDPARMDSIEFAPRQGETADFAVGRRSVDLDDANAVQGPTPVLGWHGRGDCQVDIREVVLRRGPQVMRLWMDLHVNTLRLPGSSQFVLKTPPFGSGTWRLDVCALPPGRMHAYATVPSRWVQVSASGDPGTPPQAPQGCTPAR